MPLYAKRRKRPDPSQGSQTPATEDKGGPFVEIYGIGLPVGAPGKIQVIRPSDPKFKPPLPPCTREKCRHGGTDVFVCGCADGCWCRVHGTCKSLPSVSQVRASATKETHDRRTAKSSAFIMDFGKYTDEAIEDVPTDYLEWCYETFEDTDTDRYAAIEEELNRRGWSAIGPIGL